MCVELSVVVPDADYDSIDFLAEMMIEIADFEMDANISV